MSPEVLDHMDDFDWAEAYTEATRERRTAEVCHEDRLN